MMTSKTPAVSSSEDVRRMYDQIAEAYEHMMDEEIELDVYARSLSILAEHLQDVGGPLLDTSCGTGHLLERYGREFDSERLLLGLDVSPRMVALSQKRLGKRARIAVGNMCDLSHHPAGSLAGIVSFFAIHHLDARAVAATFEQWRRALAEGGQLLLGAWEGRGLIDYGESAHLVARCHPLEDLTGWLNQGGFEVEVIETQFEEAREMNSVYLRATAR